jgi:hypothetical protein
LLEKTEYPLINPESDSEIRDNVVISQKTCSEISVIASGMDKFSSLKSLVRAISIFQRTALRRRKLPIPSTVQLRHDVELYLVKLCQNLTYSVEIANLSNGKPIPKDSALRYLDPHLDSGTSRNEWPMAVVQRVFPGLDNRVRKIELRVFKNGNVITYVRPIAEVVLLFTP